MTKNSVFPDRETGCRMGGIRQQFQKSEPLKLLVLTGFLLGLSELMPQLRQGSLCPRKEGRDKPMRIPVSLLFSEERAPQS